MTDKVTIEVRKKGVWSRLHDSCICCKTTAMKHLSKGLCQACYARTYRDAVKVRKDQIERIPSAVKAVTPQVSGKAL